MSSSSMRDLQRQLENKANDLAEANAKFLSKFKEHEVMVKTEAPDEAPHDVHVLSSLRILAIDEDHAILKFILNTSEELGHQVFACSGTTAALRLLREAETLFDVVLVEYQMPTMDGLEFLKCATKETNLPIIMMCSDFSESYMLEAIRFGASEYWIKPLTVNNLKTMRLHVAKKESSSSSKSTLIKKPKMKWTEEMRAESLKAVYQIGLEAAGPKGVHDHGVNAKFLSKSKEHGVMVKTEAPDQAPHDVHVLPSMRILAIVEDFEVLHSISDTCKELGHQVVGACRTTAGLRILQGLKTLFDIIIVEHRMPTMDGLEFLKCATKETNVPITIICSDSDFSESSMLEAIRFGASHYCIKPITKNDIMTMRMHVLRKRLVSQSKSPLKKPCMKWTHEIQAEFLNAVNKIGVEVAKPKDVLELMNKNIRGLTAKRVADRLRNHRIKLKKIREQEKEMAPTGSGEGSGNAAVGSTG